ncbi:hypothetical protein BSLG_005992 [Batrachochytrium salamandrivorans]|nr:hypothetical protein BSLG_005992 [Batrachochytrium salamandrivorans]
MADNRNATGRALQRIAQIHAAFSSANSSCSGSNKSSTFSSTDANTSSATVCIGDVVFKYGLQNIQSLFQVCQGSVFDGAQVLRYAQLSQREIEYVAISRDVSDTDLKQRREIKNGTAFILIKRIRAAIFQTFDFRWRREIRWISACHFQSRPKYPDRSLLSIFITTIFDEHTKNIFYGVLKRFDLAHHQDITSTSMALESLSEKHIPYHIAVSLEMLFAHRKPGTTATP